MGGIDYWSQLAFGGFRELLGKDRASEQGKRKEEVQKEGLQKNKEEGRELATGK